MSLASWSATVFCRFGDGDEWTVDRGLVLRGEPPKRRSSAALHNASDGFGSRQAWGLFVKSFICWLSAMVLVVGATDAAQPKKTRQQAQTEFTVPLQPFSMEPDGPRVSRTVAVEPMQVAYNVPRAVAVPAVRAERVEEEEDWDQDQDQEQEENGPIVRGKRATLRNGVAYAPADAPQSVKEAIWAANTLRRKPYIWGGGHRSFYDRGYDCSGSVSFALHSAGLLGAPLPSDDLMRYGKRGRGRWITIYSRRGHTFAVIAGLRFDTTDIGHGGDVGPRWYSEGRNTRGFVARHPAGL